MEERKPIGVRPTVAEDETIRRVIANEIEKTKCGVYHRVFREAQRANTGMFRELADAENGGPQ